MNVRTDVLVVGGIAVASFAAGAGAAWYYQKRQYETLIDSEIAQFKADYSTRMDATIAARANEEAKVISETIIARESYSPPSVDTGDGEHVTAEDIKNAIESNVFDQTYSDVPEWDQEAEEENRHSGAPFIISKAEFFEGELGFTQMNLTYYEGDDVLVDEEDQHIPDVDEIVGQDNLLKFGYGSGDPRVLYVRHEPKQIDFEVTLDSGSYASAMGYIQHDDSPRVLRFRKDQY
jgi:hypothetical protein